MIHGLSPVTNNPRPGFVDAFNPAEVRNGVSGELRRAGERRYYSKPKPRAKEDVNINIFVLLHFMKVNKRRKTSANRLAATRGVPFLNKALYVEPDTYRTGKLCPDVGPGDISTGRVNVPRPLINKRKAHNNGGPSSQSLSTNFVSQEIRAGCSFFSLFQLLEKNDGIDRYAFTHSLGGSSIAPFKRGGPYVGIAALTRGGFRSVFAYGDNLAETFFDQGRRPVC